MLAKSLTPTQWMAETNMSQAKLASKLGISPAQMSRLLSGARGWTNELSIRMQEISGNKVRADSLVSLPSGYRIVHEPEDCHGEMITES